jgi:hypothetical protein
MPQVNSYLLFTQKIIKMSSKFFSITNIFLLLAGWLFSGCSKDSAGLSSYQGQGGSTARFTLSGDYLYTVDSRKLTSYHVADPANPILVNTQDVGFEIETIFPFANRLFIGSTSVIHIFKIDNPARPEKLSTAISPTVMRRCDPVVAKDSVAFATLRSSAACGGFQSILAVYDIKDIANPVQKMSLPLNEPRGLGYADTVLYVCDPPGLQMYSISNAYSPMYLGSLNDGEYFDVIPYGNLLFGQTKTGGLIYDISKPALPVKLSQIQ